MKQMGIVEKKHIIKWHMEEIYNFYPPMVSFGIAKKHLSYYSKGLRGGAAFRNKINKMDSWVRIMDEIEKFFEKQSIV
jgi:tRNA-dihydrouridine synthase B